MEIGILGKRNVIAMLAINTMTGTTAIMTVENMENTTDGTRNANAIMDMNGNMTDASTRNQTTMDMDMATATTTIIESDSSFRFMFINPFNYSFFSFLVLENSFKSEDCSIKSIFIIEFSKKSLLNPIFVFKNS